MTESPNLAAHAVDNSRGKVQNVGTDSTGGIGEHSDLLAEISKWKEVLANADDCLQALTSHFDDEGRITAGRAGTPSGSQ